MRSSRRELLWAAGATLAAIVVSLGLFRLTPAVGVLVGAAIGVAIVVRNPGRPRSGGAAPRSAMNPDRLHGEIVRLRRTQPMILAGVPVFAIGAAALIVAALGPGGWTGGASWFDIATSSTADALLGCGHAICAARAVEYESVRRTLVREGQVA